LVADKMQTFGLAVLMQKRRGARDAADLGFKQRETEDKMIGV